MSRLGDITANIFDLLDESDGSSVESGKKAQAVLEQKKNAAAAAVAPAKPAVSEKSGNQGKKPTGERRDKPFGERRPRPEGDRPPRPAGERKPRTDRPPRPQGDSPKGENGHRAPRPDRKPRKEGEPFHRGNRREKDRESGTGRGKEAQKGGAGKGGWGNTQDQAAAVEGVSAAEAVEELKKEGEPTAEATPTETPAVKEPEPEEKWGRTLDDYVKERKLASSTLELRKLEDTGALSGLTPLKRGDEDNGFIRVEKKQSEKKVKENTKKLVPVDQVLKVQAEKKERAPREDKPRGERKGKGDRRKPAASNAPAPSFGDQSAFPTLSKA